MKIKLQEVEGYWEWAILDSYGDGLTSSFIGYATKEEARVDAMVALSDFEPLTYDNEGE